MNPESFWCLFSNVTLAMYFDSICWSLMLSFDEFVEITLLKFVLFLFSNSFLSSPPFILLIVASITLFITVSRQLQRSNNQSHRRTQCKISIEQINNGFNQEVPPVPVPVLFWFKRPESFFFFLSSAPNVFVSFVTGFLSLSFFSSGFLFSLLSLLRSWDSKVFKCKGVFKIWLEEHEESFEEFLELAPVASAELMTHSKP